VRQSLRARLTLIATALFSCAVITGAVLLLVLQRYALTRVLDQSASKTARDIAKQVTGDRVPLAVLATTPGIAGVQVVDASDRVVTASSGTDRAKSLVDDE